MLTLKELNTQGQTYIQFELGKFKNLMDIAEYNYADLHKKLEKTIREKNLIIEEVKSDLLEFQDFIDQTAIHDKNLLHYYTERKRGYDPNKLIEINRLIELE